VATAFGLAFRGGTLACRAPSLALAWQVGLLDREGAQLDHGVGLNLDRFGAGWLARFGGGPAFIRLSPGGAFLMGGLAPSGLRGFGRRGGLDLGQLLRGTRGQF